MTPEKKKILIITYYWPPSGGAGVQRWLKFTKYLPEFGWEPIVLTVDETIASYPVIDETLNKDIHPSLRVYKTKSFEILSVFGRLFGKKNIPHAGFANHNKESIFSWVLRFLRGNFLIPDARRGWNKYAFRKASELIQKEDIKHIITTSPPHSTQLVGLALKKTHPNVRWIADLRDPWTDIYYQQELLQTRMAKWLDKKFERDVLKYADLIITVGEELKKLYQKKLPLSKINKIHVVSNGFDLEDFTSPKQKPLNHRQLFVFKYIGTIAESYQADAFFNACQNILKRNDSLNFCIEFIGTKNHGYIDLLANKYGLANIIKYNDYLPHKDSISAMFDADCLLLFIPLHKEDKLILTGKIFEYLATQNPILALGPLDGEAARILDECDAGKMFSREDSLPIELYINELLSKKNKTPSLSESSKKYLNYSRKNLTHQLSKILENA